MRTVLLITGLIVLVGGGLFGAPVRNWLAQCATLANPAPPTPEVVVEMIERSSDQVAAILAAWRSGHLVHRQVAVCAGQPRPHRR